MSDKTSCTECEYKKIIRPGERICTLTGKTAAWFNIPAWCPEKKEDSSHAEEM